MSWRTFVQLVRGEITDTRVCHPALYHVWQWRTAASDPNEEPPYGSRCQCGAIEWKHP